MCGFLSGGNLNDVKAAPELVEEVYNGHVLGDCGYGNDKFRRLLESNNQNTPLLTVSRESPIKAEFSGSLGGVE